MPPAARVGDNHNCTITAPAPHVGGPILPPGAFLVLIGGRPAGRRLDKAFCAGPFDAIALGSFSVLVGGQPAARLGDMTAHGGQIIEGFGKVLIGDISSSGGSSKKYATQEEAARAALKEANPLSITANREFGGLIYQNPDGTYGYTAPAPGTAASFDPHAVSAPPGTTVVGDYHCHGDYGTPDGTGGVTRSSDPANDPYKSDDFSDTDRTEINRDGQGKPGYRGYLGTPGGTFREYNPATRTSQDLD